MADDDDATRDHTRESSDSERQQAEFFATVLEGVGSDLINQRSHLPQETKDQLVAFGYFAMALGMKFRKITNGGKIDT